MREKHRANWGDNEYSRVQKECKEWDERLKAAGLNKKTDYTDDRELRQCLGLEPRDLEAEAATAAQLQRVLPPVAGKKRVIKQATGARRSTRLTAHADASITEDLAQIQRGSVADSNVAEGRLSPVQAFTAGPATRTAVSTTPVARAAVSTTPAISRKHIIPPTGKPTPTRVTIAVVRKRQADQAASKSKAMSDSFSEQAISDQASASSGSEQPQRMIVKLKVDFSKLQNQAAATSESTTASSPAEATGSQCLASSGSAHQEKIYLKPRMNAGKAQNQPVDENALPAKTSINNARKRSATHDHADNEMAPAAKKQRTTLKQISGMPPLLPSHSTRYLKPAAARPHPLVWGRTLTDLPARYPALQR